MKQEMKNGEWLQKIPLHESKQSPNYLMIRGKCVQILKTANLYLSNMILFSNMMKLNNPDFLAFSINFWKLNET